MPTADKSSCDTCAFGNAGAGTEPYNQIRAEVCAAGAVPFWCHRNFDWKAGTPPPGAQLKICRGWQARVAQLNRQGRYADRERRGIRYWIAHNTLIWIEVLATAVKQADHDHALRQIKHGVKLLAAKETKDLIQGPAARLRRSGGGDADNILASLDRRCWGEQKERQEGERTLLTSA